MIIYEETKAKYIGECDEGIIYNKIIKNLITRANEAPEPNFIDSLENSLPKMADVLRSDLFNEELNVAIEYKINTTRKRADFIIYGKDEFGSDNVVVVELKGWTFVNSSNKKDFVFTNGGDGLKDYWHPSIQAYNYIHLLELFNEFVRDHNIKLNACSYLHDMDPVYEHILKDENKFPIITKAPTYLMDDVEKLRSFLHNHVKHPSKQLLYFIDDGHISPSPELADMLAKALKGAPFFSYDDNQAEAVATIVEKTKDALLNDKRATIIIRGGPGTGKSVVAINALGQILTTTTPRSNRRNNAVYITQTLAPKAFFKKLLEDDFTQKDIGNFFRSPLTLHARPEAEYDCVIVDEAHRVYDYKPGRNAPAKGSNFLDDLIRNSKVNVFFIDEDQAVTYYDYTTISKIKEFANKYHSTIYEGKELSLSSQFRCTGGIEYIDFVKGFLGYPGYQKKHFRSKNYMFKVFDSPKQMFDLIALFNSQYGHSRMVAGYTHEWVSLNAFNHSLRAGSPLAFDRLPYDFIFSDGLKMRWNKGMKMVEDNYSYLADPDSINQIGCIHTIQGLDLQFAGVIIGKDMVYRDGKIQFDKNANVDNVSSKINACDDELAIKLIRNTYNVLLTRGMRGTFVYCEDEALNNYLKTLVG